MSTTTVRVKNNTRLALLEMSEGQETVDDVIQRLIGLTANGRATAWSILRRRCGDDAEGLYKAIRPRLSPHERVMADRDRDKEGR